MCVCVCVCVCVCESAFFLQLTNIHIGEFPGKVLLPSKLFKPRPNVGSHSIMSHHQSIVCVCVCVGCPHKHSVLPTTGL